MMIAGFLFAFQACFWSAAATANLLPVVLWHGMGDDCCNNQSMGSITALIKQQLPGIHVHSVMVGKDASEDRTRGFLDNLLDSQLPLVCAGLKADHLLSGGFNAVGFSQGGLFLRSYVQLCNDPPVHNLITFGSPHGGVAEVPNCQKSDGISCSTMRYLVGLGVYLEYVQKRVVQAQYFKDPKKIENYLKSNIFLPKINNELEVTTVNQTFISNIRKLNKFVMIMFENDTMITPKTSAWFSSLNENGEEIPLVDQKLYSEDRLGLRALDRKGQLVFDTWPGNHMQIGLEDFKLKIVGKYLKEGSRLLLPAQQDEIQQQQQPFSSSSSSSSWIKWILSHLPLVIQI